MTKLIACLAAFLISMAASATDLGTAGNLAVARSFEAYRASGHGCEPVNGGERVIVTGFGLWGGPGRMSYSGYVLDNLASPDFWAEDAATPAPPAGYLPKNGILAKGETVRFYNRAFELPGGRVLSACLMIVNVRWDIGGAILAREMARFQPAAVVMSGIAGASAEIEEGAMNSTDELAGYAADGSLDPGNTPLQPFILPYFQAGAAIAMTWDQPRLAGLIRPMLDQMHYNLSVPSGPNPGNDYICNNISYIALQAAAGHQLALAGGALVIEPETIQPKPSIGFFHYPDVQTSDPGILRSFAEVIMTLARG